MGKLVQQRRGKGGSTFRSPKRGSYSLFKFLMLEKAYPLTLVSLTHEPGKSTPCATYKDANQNVFKTFAVVGNYVGQTFNGQTIQTGSIIKLKDAPFGHPICCIQNKPGGKPVYARSAGNYGTIIQITEAFVILKIGDKFIKLNPNCLAVYGVPAAGDRRLRPLLKAGTQIKRLATKAKKAYSVSAKNKNNNDHPFGGSTSKRLGRMKCSSRSAPPGAKVGNIAPKRCGKK